MVQSAVAIARQSEAEAPQQGRAMTFGRLPLASAARWLRGVYTARPSLTPTVYVPGPVVVARRV